MMDSGKWEKILVLQTSFLGDTILSLPLLAEIKRRLPQTKLSLLCSPSAKEVLQDHPGIDEVIVDDKRGADKGWLGLWRKARELRQMRFSAALSPHKSLRSALLLFFAAIPYRVGFRQSTGWFLFHRRVSRDLARHDVERNLSVLEAFGIQPDECDRDLMLPIKDSTQDSVTRLLRSLGVNPDRVIVGINPGSVWATKRWSAEGFARVIASIKRKYDCDVLLFGGPEDADLGSKIQKLCDGAAVNLAGKLSLRELPAAVSLCKIFITNDSGPMHVAVARGVPTVAIFCATTPSLGFYPYSKNAVVVEKNLSCRPCTSHGGRRCPLGTEDCIRLIDPEHVIRAAEKFLLDRKLPPVSHRSCYEPEFITI
jgi:heptosyltransferase-2